MYVVIKTVFFIYFLHFLHEHMIEGFLCFADF